jgi:hypothetical protein
MSKFDDFIASQASTLLQPGEEITHTAFVSKAPGLLMQMLLLGPLLVWMMTTVYFAIVTSTGRLLLMKTKLGLFGPKALNLGVEELHLRGIREVKLGGFANNRSMTFVFHDGSKRTLRISPWFKTVAGQKLFFEQLPSMVGKQLSA